MRRRHSLGIRSKNEMTGLRKGTRRNQDTPEKLNNEIRGTLTIRPDNAATGLPKGHISEGDDNRRFLKDKIKLRKN